MSDPNSVVLQLVKAAITAVAATALSRPQPLQPSGTTVANNVVATLKTDPIFINETNAEGPIESRIFWGALVAGISGLAVLVGQFGACYFDPICYVTNWQIVGPAWGAVLGAAYALYGRFASGLKPLGSGSVPSKMDAKPIPQV